MFEHLESILKEKCRLDRSRTIVVGVSGGPDSLCLMELLRQAGYPIVVAHFNHQLRPSADQEAEAVAQLAARLSLPARIESGSVRAVAEAEHLSLEEAGRNLRYRFLFDQARQLGAQAVAVAHTADDQVETILMHLIRGAGLSGLKGMSYRTLLPMFDTRIPLVRPLRDAWRTETVAYCAAQGLHPHLDPSNESLEFLRNRVRHVLIPTLEGYNPKFRESVWRTGQALAADHEILAGALEQAWSASLMQQHADYIMLDLAQLLSQSAATQRQLIRRAVECLAPGTETAYATLERASAFLGQRARARADLAGGLSLFREGAVVYVARAQTELPLDHWPQMPAQTESLRLAWPGQLELSGGWTFGAEARQLPAESGGLSDLGGDPFQVWLDAHELPNPLEVRMRRAGDVFDPLGLNGHTQKLSDFFTNEKLPARARARWPLLCAGARIIWVPGYRPAEAFKLRESTRKAAYFCLARPSRPPHD